MPLLPHVIATSQGYYRSAHALARIARQMSRQLWRPATESDGVPLEVLLNLINILNEWKGEHLQRVGVPSNFAAEWDFVSAVSACECLLNTRGLQDENEGS
jgi:hypothetical protein